jgi:DNA polymerase alpha subunit B
MEACPATAVILIPSVRDMISRHVAFPQAMLERTPELGLPKRVRLLPNPSTFMINEIVFSLSSVDVLFHLRKEEYFRRAEEAEADVAMDGRSKVGTAKDSMAELCRHVLGQKRWVA